MNECREHPGCTVRWDGTEACPLCHAETTLSRLTVEIQGLDDEIQPLARHMERLRELMEGEEE